MAEFDGDFNDALDDIEMFSNQIREPKYIPEGILDKLDVDSLVDDVLERFDRTRRYNRDFTESDIEDKNYSYERLSDDYYGNPSRGTLIINGIRYPLGEDGLIIARDGRVASQPGKKPKNKTKSREKDRVYEPEPEPKSEPKIDKRERVNNLGVLRDLVLDIDVNSSEACNVNAQAIRKSITDKLGKIGPEMALDREEYANVDFLGDGLVLNKGRVDERRVWSLISEAHGVSFVVWADLPFEDKKIFRDVLHNKPKDFAAAVLKIGVMFNGYGRKIFVPMLNNSKTENGCHITYPSGEEVDYTAINKPEMLDLTKDILLGGIDPGVGWYELIEMIGKTTENHPDVASILQLVNDRLNEPSSFLQRLDMARRHSVLHPLRLDGGSSSRMNVIAYGDDFEQGTSEHTRFKCEFVVTVSADTDRAGSSPCEVRFTLWGGKDPKIYGTENCELVKQFDLVVDELGRSKLMKYQPLSDGLVAEEATDNESNEFNIIVNSLTSYSPGEPSNPRMYPASNDELRRLLVERG